MMPGRKYQAGSVYRYGFNGKENDNEVKGEGNQQDYGFRIYDSRLGKFLSVDPITKEYPELTPYQFASNTPIQAIDLDGLEAFYFHVRSFISSKTTRDPLFRTFKGDARSTTTAEDVTARGRAQIHYDVNTRKVDIVGKPYANQTEKNNWWGLSSKSTTKTGEVNYNVNQFDNGSKKVVDLLYSTYNPLTPKILTPAVDVNSRFVVNYDKKSNSINVGFTVYADGYPSTEAFIADAKGQRILLGARKEEGSPATRLNGGAELLRFTGSITIPLDKDGNFNNEVIEGKGKDAKTYSIAEWGKTVQAKFEKKEK